MGWNGGDMGVEGRNKRPGRNIMQWKERKETKQGPSHPSAHKEKKRLEEEEKAHKMQLSL
jgi:hypothetical protein